MSRKSTDLAIDADLESLERVALLSQRRPVWLRVGQLIDGVASGPLRQADVVFDARQIRFVGKNGQPPSLEVLASGRKGPDAVLPDWTILPCLIEAHAHMFLDGATVNFQERDLYLKKPAKWMLARARARTPKLLRTGVGAVRDAGDKHGVGLALAAESKSLHARLAVAPWIDSPGAAIHHRGRYGSFMAEPLEEHDSLDDCVEARVARGADWIKLLVSGIIDFKVGRVTATPQMSADEVTSLVQAARRRGRQSFAHASGAEGVENAIEGGVTTVEHGFFMTVDQLAKMRDRQIAWVPTFAPVQLQLDRAADLGWNDTVVAHLERIIEGHNRTLCQAHSMGVRIVAGSDAGSCGVPHGIGLVQELCLMERAGMPSIAVLCAATGASAAALTFAEPIGQIAPGCRARFILTPHDPTATVANLLKEKCVVFDGQALQCPSDLDSEGL